MKIVVSGMLKCRVDFETNDRRCLDATFDNNAGGNWDSVACEYKYLLDKFGHTRACMSWRILIAKDVL